MYTEISPLSFSLFPPPSLSLSPLSLSPSLSLLGCSSLPAVLITGDNHTEEPMDVPGATVEVVATTTSANSVAVSEKKNTSSRRKVATPTYREELLLKWEFFSFFFLLFLPNDEIILALRAPWQSLSRQLLLRRQEDRLGPSIYLLGQREDNTHYHNSVE